MSGQRDAAPSDSRFPRDRSPARPAFPSVHPSRGPLLDTRPANPSPTDSASPGGPPRGPKAFGEHRAAGPPPPRGRGFGSRGDYRSDFRDRDTFRGPRDTSPPADRPWREYERRDARSPPLDHPSHPDFRGARDAPARDFDAGRGRRGFRDAPPSSRFGEPRPPAAFQSSRDDFARGRGRPDWAPRGRGRGGPYHEDRATSYRPRSRSPRAFRTDREGPSDRYDEPRYDRRDSDAAADREERARDAERYRRDYLANSTGVTRAANASPSPSSPNAPQSYDAFGPVRAMSGSDRGAPPQRRESSNFVPLANRDSRESLPSRLSSPPPAPEVPAFGSVSFKPPSNPEVPWNVWKAPVEQRPAVQPTAAPSQQQSQVSPRLATAPKAELDKNIPKAPKALQAEVQQTPADPSDASLSSISVQPKTTSPVFSSRALPSGKVADIPQVVDPIKPARPPPTGPRQVPGAPLGPKGFAKFESSPPSGSRNGPTPTGPKVPTSPQSASTTLLGPRASLAGIAANKFANSAVPTGPRASRTASSQQPRIPTGPSSERSWQRPRVDVPHQPSRGPPGLVPAKRDHDGLEKEQKPAPDYAGTQQAEENGSVVSGVETAADSPSGQRNGAGPAVDYSDDEDAMDLDEGDMAQNEEKFERDKAWLEAQKIDLGSRRLRASTPLERLGLLGHLALYDPALFFESRQAKAPRHASDLLQDSSTPKGEESEVVEELPLRPSPKLSPSPIATPELKTLPFLTHEPLTPMSDLEPLQDNLKRQDTAKTVLHEEIHRRSEVLQDEEEHLRRQYEMYYRNWRAEVKILDQAQRAKEEAERQEAADPVAEAGAADLSPTVTSATEPRRRGFTSEYELQRVLELSREQAEKEAQARREKEIVNARPDYDREAVIPDLAPELDLRSPMHQDIDRLCDPRHAVDFWDLMPPQDDFTKEEHDAMLQNFKEYPKKFGKIAQGLRGRTYKDCINHYYATKWNQQYKPPRDKRRARAVRSQRTRTGSGLNPRPRANQLISNLEDTKPELYDGEEANAPLAAVTESGRPRRAAAPNFRERETGDQSAAATPARRGARADASGNDKSSRKVKGSTRDRSRKTKLQPSARQPSMSPEKQMLDGPSDSRAWPNVNDTDSTAGLAQLPPGSGSMAFAKPDPQAAYPMDYQGNALAFGEPEAGKIQTVRGGHVAPSSYWSVHEVNLFPQLLKHFGTDWPAISNAMGTKSHTMVKNYFGRLKLTDSKSEIEAMANEGDIKRDRGENTGAPPTPPTFTPKRRTELPHSTVPRTLAPSTEAVDMEDESPPSTAVGMAQPPTSTPGYAPQQSYSHPIERQHSRSGSFGQPPIPSQAQQGPPAHAAYPASPHMQHERHRPYAMDRGQELGVSRPMENPSSAYSTQSRDLWERSSRGGEIFQPPVFQRNTSGPSIGGLVRAPSPPRYPERTLFGPASSRPRPPDRRLSDEYERAPLRRAESPQPQSSLRYVMDASNPRPASTSYYDPMRPSSITAREAPGSITRPIAPETPKPGPSVAKAEPRKMSNLAAILNADPVEPKSAGVAAPLSSAASRIHTPPQFASQSGYSSGFAPARPLSQPTRNDYLSESARPPLQPHQRVSYGAPEAVEGHAREPSMHSGSYRVEWPKSMQPHDRAVEPASPYEHRAAIRGFDARYNPSPPPPPPAGGPQDPGRPYDSRLSSAHYNPPYRPSTPPTRYNYGPPTHSRDSSLSQTAGVPRESQYLHEHRPTGSGSSMPPQARVSDRPPPAPPVGAAPMRQAPGSVYSPYSHQTQPSGMSSRAKADWTQGIQYREYEERAREGERAPERGEGEWERSRERETEGRHDRYAPVGYGALGGPPAYAPRDERR